MALDSLIIAFLAGAGGATVARLLALEDGPAFVLNDARQRLESWAKLQIRTKNSEETNKAIHSFVDFIACPICQSVWWAGLCAVVFGAMANLPLQWIFVSVVCAPSIAWAIGNAGGWTRS